MKILGLHFGHDACVTLLDDGRPVTVLERERTTRTKHALGLKAADIKQVLEDTATDLREIDYCSITSTQHVELVFLEPDQLRVSYQPCRGETLKSWIHDQMPGLREHFLSQERFLLREVIGSSAHPYLHFMSADERAAFPTAETIGNIEDYLWVEEWDRNRTLSEIAKANYSGIFKTEATRLGFHYPATVHLFGREIPACILSHQMAHAAYAYYQSPFDEAAVITHDGNIPARGLNGLFYYGAGEKLWAVTPHYLPIGLLYDQVAENIGFPSGGPGKLMGLSSYGKARFSPERFLGNSHDVVEFQKTEIVAKPWLEFCLTEAHRLGYDLTKFGKPEFATAPINIDIAASTQLLFEESLLRAVASCAKLLANSGRTTNRLCLSGGTALNCPANSRVAAESPFPNVFIPPGCGDSGLSTGSALALYHNVLGLPRKSSPRADVYVGLGASCRSSSVTRDDVAATAIENPAKEAAAALASNEVIGWFEGRSELGPRALGHRSILANPTFAENWERVNQIKRRERWRPFAPIVLEEAAAEWFDEVPIPSPYMLFNARVLRPQIPAVTHVDGSARIQTVSPADGAIYELVREFGRLTGVPVLLNTSFNGPGEPIVETPDDALRFLANSPLDAVYFPDSKLCARRRANLLAQPKCA
ncbi:MAG: carbamoyltransferase C-terminal domain-containing protein [Planctomycetaceae bacterium]